MKLSTVLFVVATTGAASAQPSPAVSGAPDRPVVQPAVSTDPPAAPSPTGSDDAPVVAPPTATPPPAPAPAAPDVAVLNALIDARVDERLALRKDTAGFKDGFFITTTDAKTKLKIGGFTQFDGRFFVADSKDPKVDQFGFRSIRPDLQGTLYEHFDFRLLPDFAGGKVVIQDAYADLHDGEAVKVRFGKFKVPFGLERLQGETNTLFVERGLPTQLAPNRDLGVQVFGELAKGVVAYQVGVFNGVADGGSSDGDVSDDKEAAVRVFIKPFAAGTDARLTDLGFGGAATFGDKRGTLVSTDVPTFKTQGQTTFFAYKTGTTLMDTVVASGRQWRATGQASWYTGPVGLLGEYVRSVQHVALDTTKAKVTTESWQAVAQLVLTGDNATYKSVTPKHPFDPSKGQWGAFDVGARVGELRLVDTGLYDLGLAAIAKAARKAWSAGGGVSWYPNKNFRFVLDYERTWFKLGAKTGDRATENSIVGRVQTVF